VRPREIRELARLRRFEPDRDRRLLRRCHDLEDLRRAARRRLPAPVFGYVDGGADDELTLAANRAALRSWQFRPRVLRDVADPDLRTPVLGGVLPAPLGLAPTGFTRLVHAGGETAVARAAASRGLPYCLSTVGTVSIEDIAGLGDGELWFQLYVLGDRNVTRALISRAAAAGYTALEVTLDTTVAGRRLRDLRTGVTMPPALTPGALLSVASHPRYWLSLLRGPALEFASLKPYGGSRRATTIADIQALFDPRLTWSDLAVVRALWPGKLLVKGPLGPADAVRAVSAGVDGIHLSNHGGRQLDRCIPAIDLVRPVREAVGDGISIVVDSGIRHGADIAVAVARGADLCMIGRGYLYGLAAAGQPGVEHAIDLLVAQLRRTLQLMGVTSVAELRQHGDELVARPDGIDAVRGVQGPGRHGQPPAVAPFAG
jgi:L-lactate dehydrogenase (cytochrome)